MATEAERQKRSMKVETASEFRLEVIHRNYNG